MGNSWFCNRCDIDKFQVSRKCASQFLLDDKLSSEEKWMEKLKCLDDQHSTSLQITAEDFDKLIKNVEKALVMQPEHCKNKELLIECLKRNPTCILKCNREMNEFIDCIDLIRIKRIKEVIQQERRKKRVQFSI